jgi:hypothetical protein
MACTLAEGDRAAAECAWVQTIQACMSLVEGHSVHPPTIGTGV